jgi:hypothetical protein
LKDDGVEYDPINDVNYTGFTFIKTPTFHDKVIIKEEVNGILVDMRDGDDLTDIIDGGQIGVPNVTTGCVGNYDGEFIADWSNHVDWELETNGIDIDYIDPIADGELFIDSLGEEIDYIRINAELVQIFDTPGNLIDKVIKVYALNVANSKHNPLKIIDYKADVTIANIPLWNPAKDHHYHSVKHLIDIKRDNDPAEYNVGTILSSTILDPSDSKVLDSWNVEHVGDVLLDDSCLTYYPYYDDIVEPTLIIRMEKCGRLADWGEAKLYQWTKSEVAPNEWNDVATIESVDKTIPNSIRKSGTVREIVYNSATSLYEKPIVKFNEYTISTAFR